VDPGAGLEDYNGMGVEKIRSEDVDCIKLAHDRIQ
jgi:hypothetical protein